jgi:hypothetical protein
MAEVDGLYPVEQGMVLVLGETGAGKSYFIRKLTSNSAVIVGHSLESCKFIAPSGILHLRFEVLHAFVNGRTTCFLTMSIAIVGPCCSGAHRLQCVADLRVATAYASSTTENFFMRKRMALTLGQELTFSRYAAIAVVRSDDRRDKPSRH